MDGFQVMPMAQAATDSLRSRGRAPAGGLVVAPAASASPHPSLRCVPGDHPEPGPGSLAAADALAAVAAQVSPADEVWVLLSGGTTSLIGAPEPGLSADDLTRLYSLLLGSGLDITAMNRINGLATFVLSVGASLAADLLWFWAGRRYGYPVLRFLCKVSLSPDTCVREIVVRVAR